MNHQEMKTAVITGGASGIGLAIAEKFVKEQIRCILIGRDQDKLQKASDLLGPLAFGVSFDLTNLSGL
ncbi:MAG: SDR family NAD(P)-dependent oxidoreductase, partial [Bacteroidales bacterium]|nr:SDR family NAD(P)-dependent oxidoreductase [Bacteroidales bacterium]